MRVLYRVFSGNCRSINLKLSLTPIDPHQELGILSMETFSAAFGSDASTTSRRSPIRNILTNHVKMFLSRAGHSISLKI
jgi:hypothetical protein